MKILIKDKIVGGNTKNSFSLECEKSVTTVKELIRLRIFEEVAEYNEQLPEYFSSLVQPTNAEITLNGYKMREKRKLNAEKQYYLVLDAFAQNAFFLIINNKQVDSLEQLVEVKENMELNFIKLIPLVGG